jgi:guanylate kinase
MDGNNYKPNPAVLERLKTVTFVGLVGPTAAGKSTLIKGAMAREPRLHLVRNHTSRTPREGEQDRTEVMFHPRQDMEWRIAKGDYVQVAPSVFGDLYATAPDDYSSEGISVLPILADAVPVLRSLPFNEVRIIFVVPPNWNLWLKRMAQHNFTLDKLERRMQEAERSLAFALADRDSKVLVDLDVETGVEDLITLALNQPMSERLQADQERGRQIAGDLLIRMRGK